MTFKIQDSRFKIIYCHVKIYIKFVFGHLKIASAYEYKDIQYNLSIQIIHYTINIIHKVHLTIITDEV